MSLAIAPVLQGSNDFRNVRKFQELYGKFLGGKFLGGKFPEISKFIPDFSGRVLVAPNGMVGKPNQVQRPRHSVLSGMESIHPGCNFK